jgi:uncharacterized protein
MTIPDYYAKLPSHLEWLRDRSIFVSMAGSISQGLNTEFSDIDLRGICIPPIKYFYGFTHVFEQYITNDPADITVFNITKWFSLAKDGNPNALEMLFVDPKHYISVSDAGKLLLDNRHRFLSKNVKERFISYAKGQAHRMKNHRKWFSGAFGPPPSREEFGLPKVPVIAKEQFLAVQAAINKKLEDWNPDFEPFSEPQKLYLKTKLSRILGEMEILADDKWEFAARSIGLDENFIRHMQLEKQYMALHKDYESYLGWKKNRNPKRAAMEEKAGFDCKFACQLVRLLRVGKELMETGNFRVLRTDDRPELMDIKEGRKSYEWIIDYADKMEDELEEIAKTSKLPDQPDYVYLDNLCIRLVEMYNR